MLTIIINWIYILFTIFCMGFCFSRFTEKVLGYRLREMNTLLMAGLVIATVYAQVFSLFGRVNIEANMVMLVFCGVVCVVFRKSMLVFLKESLGKTSRPVKWVIPILFLLWAFFTSRGYMVPDMNLYHGQSIRWIEDYGVVKGLGNLHNRFGYNSSIFAVSALYSMEFLLGRSLHAVNGLIAFLMSLEVLKLGDAVKRRRMLLSDYARVGLFYYMSIVWDEIIAPSSDYAVMFMLFFVVIKWLAQLEQEREMGRKEIAPYALLCVAGVYTLTLKVTAGLIVLLVLKPAVQLIQQKRWKEIVIYLGLGLAAAVPWLVRNVIITGWLLYPFPALDLFDLPWKMTDLGIINTDAAMIKVYARGARGLGVDATLREWMPVWFETQLLFTEKILILAAWVAVVCVAIMAVWTFVKKKWQQLDWLLVLGTVCASFLFWQFSAPMMRYGYSHVLLLVGLFYGYVVEHLDTKLLVRAVYAGLALFMLYRGYTGARYLLGIWDFDAYVWQEDYGTYELDSVEIDGVMFYYNSFNGLTGYEAFPTMPDYAEGAFSLLGDELEDGFRCGTGEE